MHTHNLRSFSLARGAILVVALIALLAPTLPCSAGDTGDLKLKVRHCAGTYWLAGAEVDVIIYRPGVGEVDSDSGTTDKVGYVSITFTDLEHGDEARVTVTPKGMSPDDDHTYYWTSLGKAGLWDIEMAGDSLCEDDWYDEENNIILLKYD